MRDKIVSFIKSSFILTLSQIVIKAINFFLLPLYTRNLTTAQLGVSDTMTTVVGLVFPILVLGLDSAFGAFYFDENSETYRDRLFNTTLFVLIVTSLIPIIATVFSRFFAELIFNNPNYSSLFLIIALIICSNLWYLPFALSIRLQNRITTYAIITTISSIVLISSNILTVSVLKLGESALLISSLVSNGVLLLLFACFSKCRINTKSFSPTLLNRLLKYSLPLVPMVITSWILTTSDRFILLRSVGESSVGIYGIAARFVTLINILANSIYISYTSFAFSSKNDANIKNVYVVLLDIIVFLITIISLIGSFFAKEIMQLMTTTEYYTGYILIPFALFGQIFYAANTIVSYGLSFNKKSNYIIICVAAGALLNLSLNILFIPRYGALAAIITTWLGYCLMFILTNHFSQKFYPCSYHIKKVLLCNCCLTIISVLCITLLSVGIRICAFILVLLAYSFIYRDTISKIRLFVASALNKKRT